MGERKQERKHKGKQLFTPAISVSVAECLMRLSLRTLNTMLPAAHNVSRRMFDPIYFRFVSPSIHGVVSRVLLHFLYLPRYLVNVYYSPFCISPQCCTFPISTFALCPLPLIATRMSLTLNLWLSATLSTRRASHMVRSTGLDVPITQSGGCHATNDEYNAFHSRGRQNVLLLSLPNRFSILVRRSSHADFLSRTLSSKFIFRATACVMCLHDGQGIQPISCFNNMHEHSVQILLHNTSFTVSRKHTVWRPILNAEPKKCL